MPKIQTIELAGGEKRYRFTLDVGRHPVTGQRQQRRYTFRRMKDARAELGRLTGAVADGTYIDRWDGTVNDLCDDYLRSATFGKADDTRACYRDALRVPREQLGTRKARSITRADIEVHVRDYMLAEGRVRGGTKAQACRRGRCGSPWAGCRPRSTRQSRTADWRVTRAST